MTEEIWKDIEEVDGTCQVSNLGRVKSKERYVDFADKKGVVRQRLKKEKLIAIGIKPNGYCHVKLTYNGKLYTFYLHRLVAKYFCKGWFEEAEVNHKDGDKSNNCVENIRWDIYNQIKIPIEQFKEIKEKYERGQSQASLAREYGISTNRVNRIVNNKYRFINL